MKIKKINTRTDYNTVNTGTNVDLTYRDALFLFHALNAIRDNMKVLQEEVLQLTDNIEPNAMLRDTGSILESINNLLRPIVEEVVIPKESIDLFNYTSDDDEAIVSEEPIRKSKSKDNYGGQGLN